MKTVFRLVNPVSVYVYDRNRNPYLFKVNVFTAQAKYE